MSKAPEPCKGGCGRLIRDWDATKDEYPNTVAQFKAGKCRMCANRKPGEPKGRKIHRRPPACMECGRPLRSSHIALAADPPNARRYAGRGLCQACYDRLKRHGRLPPPGVHADAAADLAPKAKPYTGRPDQRPVKMPPSLPSTDQAVINAAALAAWQRARRERRSGRR